MSAGKLWVPSFVTAEAYGDAQQFSIPPNRLTVDSTYSMYVQMGGETGGFGRAQSTVFALGETVVRGQRRPSAAWYLAEVSFSLLDPALNGTDAHVGVFNDRGVCREQFWAGGVSIVECFFKDTEAERRDMQAALAGMSETTFDAELEALLVGGPDQGMAGLPLKYPEAPRHLNE